MTHDELLDEMAIRNLTAMYADAMNRAEVDEAVRVFADDALFIMMDRPSVVGRQQIADSLRGSVVKYAFMTQMMHSGVVQLDGDHARARWQVTELQVFRTGERRLVVGRYEDEHVRLAEGWRFARRTFTARYLGDVDLSSDVLPDAPPLFPLWG